MWTQIFGGISFVFGITATAAGMFVASPYLGIGLGVYSAWFGVASYACQLGNNCR